MSCLLLAVAGMCFQRNAWLLAEVKGEVAHGGQVCRGAIIEIYVYIYTLLACHALSSNKKVERELKSFSATSCSLRVQAELELSAVFTVPGCLWKCRLLCHTPEKAGLLFSQVLYDNTMGEVILYLGSKKHSVPWVSTSHSAVCLATEAIGHVPRGKEPAGAVSSLERRSSSRRNLARVRQYTYTTR